MSPLRLISRNDDYPIARVNGQSVLPSEFMADIQWCAEQLPAQQFVINLCTHRYWFMVGFFAAIVRGQTNLLPSKRSAAELQRLSDTYPSSYFLTDLNNTEDSTSLGPTHSIGGQIANNGKSSAPQIDPDLCAAIAFTSGSTGAPQAHKKSWAMLSEFRRWHRSYLPGDEQTSRGLVATVPAWHMYGLEWAMMLPTCAPISVHCGADFFPGDLVQALNEYSVEETILVATPTHLRALIKAPKTNKPVSTTITATAPLTENLCSSVETHLRTTLFEIYGCSEIGSLAWRAPGKPEHQNWEFFSGLTIKPQAVESEPDTLALTVHCEHVATPVLLSDRFEGVGGSQYQLLGRASDMVKVAGKRESLANINNRLLGVEGVVDGLIYNPEHYQQPATGRLAALVVAPDISDQQLRSELAKVIDAAFLPRPIRRVSKLPRADTSKLSQHAVVELLNQLST